MDQKLVLDTRTLARTRHGSAVASEHLLEVRTRPAARRHEGWIVRRYGRIVLLPDAGLPPREAVDLLLREAYGVQTVGAAAAWLGELVAPGEGAILERLEHLRVELTSLSDQIEQLQAERERTRGILEVLAARDEALEVAVRDLLRRLGADVRDPVEGNKEDGWVRVTIDGEVQEGVLEIKSTQRPAFDEKGLRQLMDWIARGQQRGQTYKGIFIGNHAYAVAPSERGDPFSSSFRKTATAHGIVAVTAWTLLRKLQRVVDNGSDPAPFWRGLFSTNGMLE